LFQVLLKSRPNALERVVAIAGDCMESDLGISFEDRRLLTDQVQLVIHSAATVNFLEPLHVALDINTRATRVMLQLAKEIKHLQAFVYLSSAFSNCVIPYLTEDFYPGLLKCSADKVLHLREMLDEKVFDDMAPVLMGKFPNTYTYTKALAEQVVQTESDQVPVCVLRPAAIIATDREPVSGWIDNFYGPITFIYGVGFGILRVLRIDRSIANNTVPVDCCANLAIAICWKTAQGKRELPPAIYNYSAHSNNLILGGDFLESVVKQRFVSPMETTLWYPFVICITNRWLYKFAIIFYHLLPGFFLDLMLRLRGRRPRFIKLYKKAHMNMEVLTYFFNNSYCFETLNTNALWKSLCAADQKIFPFDMEFFDWDHYFERALRGMRTYLAKQ
ncbi:hypothetical protein KR222_007981, partial [Zaprionus bogoriensis]